MQLHSPFIISSRLLPALQIGDGTLSLDHIRGVEYRFHFDLPSGEFTDTGLRTGHGQGTQSAFASMLSFLGAAVESYRYYRLDYDKAVEADSNATLFPREIVEWAYQNDSEIQTAQLEIEESGTVLIEE